MKFEVSLFRLASLPSVMMLVVGLLPVLGDFSVGRAEENDAAVEQSPLYVFRFIEVAPENVAKWRQAVKDKQLKFNTGKDSAQWGTWRILTGPRANQFARGFRTTKALYTNPIHPVQGIAASWEMPEANHWLEHISPLQESSGNQQIWRPIEGLFSQGITESGQPRFSQHRRWRMKPGMYQRLEANYKKLIAAFDHLQQPVDFSIARLEDGGDFMIYAETLAYNDTADMPGVGQVRQAFIDLHGEGEWEKYLQEHNAVMQENAIVETETWMYEPDLSNLAAMPGSEHAKTKVQEHMNRVVTAFKKQDIDALSRRIAVLTQLADAEHLEQMNKSQELQGLSVETKVLRDETTRRRQDVIRLQNELEELKTDRFRLVELRRVLTDRLLRSQLENEALEVRFQQMKKLTDQ